MSEHPNATLLRKAHELFAKRDVVGLRELLSEDIVWHNAGDNPLSGDHRGFDAVFAMFAKNLELNEGTGRFEVHDVLANDEHAVALLRANSRRPAVGKELHVKEIHVCHVREGKIVELWVFAEDQRINDEYWSS